MGMEVNKKKLSEIIGKSPRWIDKLIEEGLPVESGGGRGKAKLFDTQEVIEWLIEFEINKRYGSDSEPGTDADERLKTLRGDKLELEIDEKNGTVGPRSGFTDIAFNIGNIYTAQLDGLGPRVSGDLSVLDDPAEIIHYLHAETRRIRAATSEQLLAEVSALAAEAAGLFAANAGEDGELTVDEDSE